VLFAEHDHAHVSANSTQNHVAMFERGNFKQ